MEKKGLIIKLIQEENLIQIIKKEKIFKYLEKI